jgi:cytochrome c oxidase subunit 3
MMEPAQAPHFADRAQEVHAQRFGMWVFLASEALLFAALLTLYAAYRAHFPEAFAHEIGHANRLLGTLNTLILITSSLTAALAAHARTHGKPRTAATLLMLTLLGALAFLVVKTIEYGEHLHEGLRPGMQNDVGTAMFYNLYFLLTGAHAVHVLIGMAVLSWVLVRCWDKRRPHDEAVELAALYWHLVDLVWVFLWPLFYLTGA